MDNIERVFASNDILEIKKYIKTNKMSDVEKSFCIEVLAQNNHFDTMSLMFKDYKWKIRTSYINSILTTLSRINTPVPWDVVWLMLDSAESGVTTNIVSRVLQLSPPVQWLETMLEKYKDVVAGEYILSWCENIECVKAAVKTGAALNDRGAFSYFLGEKKYEIVEYLLSIQKDNTMMKYVSLTIGEKMESPEEVYGYLTMLSVNEA